MLRFKLKIAVIIATTTVITTLITTLKRFIYKKQVLIERNVYMQYTCITLKMDFFNILFFILTYTNQKPTFFLSSSVVISAIIACGATLK